MQMIVVESVVDGFHCVIHGMIQNIIDQMQMIIHQNPAVIRHRHQLIRAQLQPQLHRLTKQSKIKRAKRHQMV